VLQALGQWLAGIVVPAQVTVASSTGNAALEPGTMQVTVAHTLVETQLPASTTVILQ